MTPLQPEIVQNDPPAANKWLALTGIGLGVLMATLDSSIVNISLPTLIEQLHTSLATVQWVVLAYLLVVTALMLGVARLGDMLGKKRLYMAGVVLFTLGSLLCGAAPNVGWLIGFRALQGLGAVMMQALGMAIVTEVFPARERGQALGVVGSIVSFGIASGPVIGGLLIGFVGWRSVFLVNVPVGILTFLVVWRVVPSSQARAGQRFDMPGALVLGGTLVAYSLGMTFGQNQGFTSLVTLAMLGAALAGLAGFIAVECRSTQPMVNLGLFRNTLFSLNLLMGVLTFVVLASLFVLPFFLELVKGLSTQQTGLLVGAVPISMALVAPISGRLSDRYGPRLISVIGLVIMMGAFWGLSTVAADISIAGYLLRVMPIGVGFGMFQSPNNSAIMGSAPRDQLGVASGLLSLSRTVGQSTGLPLMAALFNALVALQIGGLPGADLEAVPPEALASGVAGVFRITMFVVLAALMLAAAAFWLGLRRRADAPAET